MSNPPQKRSIVVDTSVVVPAYFPESITVGNRDIPLYSRAQRILNAIRINEALAFAPEILRFEFITTVNRKMSGYAGERQFDKAVAEEHVFDFWELPIIWVPGKSLDYVAWDLIQKHKIAPPDSYHLACAIVHDAELWISHEHKDGFAEHARAVHDKVYTLTRDDFNVRA